MIHQLIPLQARRGSIERDVYGGDHLATRPAELLKTMLLRCKGRSFILLGHSLGARVVVSALSSYGTTDDATRLLDCSEAQIGTFAPNGFDTIKPGAPVKLRLDTNADHQSPPGIRQ